MRSVRTRLSLLTHCAVRSGSIAPPTKKRCTPTAARITARRTTMTAGSDIGYVSVKPYVAKHAKLDATVDGDPPELNRGPRRGSLKLGPERQVGRNACWKSSTCGAGRGPMNWSRSDESPSMGACSGVDRWPGSRRTVSSAAVVVLLPVADDVPGMGQGRENYCLLGTAGAKTTACSVPRGRKLLPARRGGRENYCLLGGQRRVATRTLASGATIRSTVVKASSVSQSSRSQSTLP